MTLSGDRPSKPRFSLEGLRILVDAEDDTGYPELQPAIDLQLLMAFLERFDRLGWLPPVDEQKRLLLSAHGVIMHVVRSDLCFYEFCAKGGRGERDPWITIFFHVNERDRQVRICGVELTNLNR